MAVGREHGAQSWPPSPAAVSPAQPCSLARAPHATHGSGEGGVSLFVPLSQGPSRRQQPQEGRDRVSN